MDPLAGIPSHLMWEDKAIPEAKNKMGKDDFMKLLLVQLQNQDPTKPMEHKEFATQLAQFGTLEKLTNIDQGIQGLTEGRGEDVRLKAMTMIGKNIEAQGRALELSPGKPVTFRHALDSETQPIRAMIFDGKGRNVRNLALQGLKSSEIKWDGRDDNGKELPGGDYKFKVLGMAKDGSVREVGSEVAGVITGVEMKQGKPVLVVQTKSGQIQVEMKDVAKVTDSSSRDTVKTSERSAKPVGSSSQEASRAKEGQDVGSPWDSADRGWRGVPDFSR